MSCGSFGKKPLEKLCDAVLIDDCAKARSLIDGGSIKKHPAPPPNNSNSSGQDPNVLNHTSIDGYHFMRELPEDNSGQGGGFFTPLHLAAYIGSPEMCHLLIERGADVNVRTKRWRFLNTTPYAGYGWFTPLHIAAQRGHASVVCKLIQRNATQGFRTQRGLTAVQLASEEVKMLLQNAADAKRRATEMDEQLGLGPEGDLQRDLSVEAPPPLVVREAEQDKGKDTPAKAKQKVADDDDAKGKGKEL